MTKIRAAVVAVAVLAALPQLAVAGPPRGDRATPGTPETLREGDILHVASVPFSQGSDIEFATKTVKELDADGQPMCERGPDGECLRDEGGDLIYKTQVRDYAFLGRLSQPVWVVDITVPYLPFKVSEIRCSLNQNDVQVAGNTLVMAVDGTGSCKRADNTPISVTGFATADITDPRFPRYLGKAQVPLGAHNVTVHPTQPLVYVSNGELVGPAQFHIWDIANPANPVKVKDWQTGHPQDPPHDITFNADGTRAYCACGSHSEIINTTDPRNPALISVIPSPENSYAHQSDPTPDGDYLLVTDELGGGATATPSPGGGIHVYDIRNEAAPVKVGTFWADSLGMNGVSTAHVFRINPDGYTMAIAWYNDGVHVIDFSDIRGLAAGGSGVTAGIGARTIGSMKLPNADTWAAKMWQERHPGYVFANDIARGLDIFYVPTLGETAGRRFEATGTLRATHQITYNLQENATMTEFTTECSFSPRSNGLDAWVMKLAPDLNDGGHDLIASARASAGAYDLDIYFFDGSCASVGMDEEEGTTEIATIPGSAVYAAVAAYTPGQAPVGPGNIALLFESRRTPV